MEKFNDLKYVRPDYQALKKDLTRAIKDLKKAQSYEEFKDIYLSLNEKMYDVSSMQTIASVRNTINMNDKFYEAENAKISGRASITSGKDGKYSSGSAYVGYIGGGADNAVTFENVSVDRAGEYTLRIYYVSGERRNLSVDVNGSKAAELSGLYANRNDWSGIADADTKVTLKEGNNTVKLYNASGNGPSIDRIAVVIPYEDVAGDVNLDGEFSVADLVLMQRYLLGREKFSKKHFAAADLNSDSAVDVYDMIRFRKMIIS